jgi:peptide/nickel transport system permease protein
MITALGLQFGRLLGGATVLETVLAFPGVGLLEIAAVYNRDYPLVRACVLLVAVCFVSVTFVIDLLYAMVDPGI